jgi:phosphoglycolate phosphatase-like HAD superfamily hydrolase/GNAT superfamily N-acetyltransferase
VPESPGRTHEDDLIEQERRTLSMLVAWSGVRPVGCGLIHWPGPRTTSVAAALAGIPEIYRLWVHESERERGVGSRLLCELEALARGRGLRQIGLGVGLSNPRARALYQRVGYVEAGIASYDDVWFYVAGSGTRIEVRDRCDFLVKPLTAPALVLFDIDGTLLLTEGAGRKSMREACAELFGPSFEMGDVDVRGRLDPHIWLEIARHNGIDVAREPDFRVRYSARLERRLAETGARALPGVAPLLARLAGRSDLTLGILSGNYPETGRLKLAAAGLDPDRFEVCAWGCDAPSRPDLIPVALARYRARAGTSLPGSAISLIGDTPHDVACARAHGCRSLGVATGGYSADDLRRAGADIVLPSLAEIESVESWILASAPPELAA